MTHFETRPANWLSVPEALDRVLGHARTLGRERVPLHESLGRALASGVRAGARLPPWDNSAMDGYAVRSLDIRGASSEAPVSLQVVGETPAGEPSGPRLNVGQAIRIMTGAPVPPGADSVVRVEDTDAEETPGLVRIFSDADGGRNIRPGGQDMEAGEEVLPAGTTLGPGQIGLLTAAGVAEVELHRRPRVAILSNGDELAPPEQFDRVIRGEAVPETNSPTLVAAVRLCGCVPIHLGIAGDSEQEILAGVSRAQAEEADVLLTSGGASLGEHDLFKRVLDGIGFRVDFWRVKMRPGTPFSMGFLPRTGDAPPLPVFGLPGNPASSFVTFQIFCRPFLLRSGGHARAHRPVLMARAGEPLKSPSDLTHFFRVSLTGDPADPEVFLTGPQTSGLVRGQGLARGLAVIPQGSPKVEVGTRVRVILLDDFGLGGEEPGYMGR